MPDHSADAAASAPLDELETAEAVRWCSHAYEAILQQVGVVVVGCRPIVEQILIALLSAGHVLLEGVPGVAKGLVAGRIAATLGLSFRRIELTADLKPSDLLGTTAFHKDPNTGRRCYGFLRGPLFANVVLVDQLERCRPRTQAALLAAVQQGQISADGQSLRLPDPFLLLVARNPLEQDEPQPLRAGQLDRFLLHLMVDYPDQADEWEIARRQTGPEPPPPEPVLSAEQVSQLRRVVRRVAIDDHVLGYAWALVRASRPRAADSPDFVDRWIAWGSGPRGLVGLVLASKARAALHGRVAVSEDDIQQMAKPVLRHRIAGNEAAQAHAITSDRLIEMLMEAIRPSSHYAPPDRNFSPE